MEEALAKSLQYLPQVVAVALIFTWLIWKFISVHKEELENSRIERQEIMKDYKSFVMDNNHKITDLVSEVAKNVAENTSATENHTKTLERLVDRLGK